MKPTKTERLQKLWDENKSPDQYNFEIEYKPFSGWWLIPDECRFLGDEGEFLGHSFKEAERILRRLL